MCVYLPMEATINRSSGAGVPGVGNYKLQVLGSEIGSSVEKQALLNAEPSLQHNII